MTEIFCVQDRTGTAAQLTIDDTTTSPIEVRDTGIYTGRDWNGVSHALNFTVGQVNDPVNFCITTMTPTGASGEVLNSRWPKAGTITWLTGSNSVMSPDTCVVIDKHPANVYTTEEYFLIYHGSRGNVVVESPLDPIRRALVQAADYINQNYRYKGIKLLQYFSNNVIDPRVVDPWFSFNSGYGFGSFAGTAIGFGSDLGDITSQYTEWPRQGVVDYNGDNVFGIPQVIKDACCEAALRVMSGVPLQPDYDTDLVSGGGVAQSITDKVGPIETIRSFDTRSGLGFFPKIPQVSRMLSKAGILLAGGGRQVMR